MRKSVVVGVVILVSLFKSMADEGMWLPSLLSKMNIDAMRGMGYELTPADIYDVNNSSFKDAVLAIDRGSCTGELISAEGLFLTNHHCGLGEIQRHSTEENNILKNGFWASTKEEELINPGKTVTFLIRMEDVTDTILSKLNDAMNEAERNDSINALSVRLEMDAVKNSHYDARIRSMYESNRFYLFVTETFRDIRLVGTPPNFIGKFGGDTDNWVWPRHTGDFSLFRIYTDPDGKPAEYAPENIPLKSRHFFPISLKGYEEGDFTLILGYPASTNRYLTSYGIQFLKENQNDIRISVREKKLAIINEYMTTSEKATIQYASKHNRSSNYYKYSIGQNRGLERLDVMKEKQKMEAEFEEWSNKTEESRAKYTGLLPAIKEVLSEDEDDKAYRFLVEALLQGPEMFYFANQFSPLSKALNNTKQKETIEAELEMARSRSEKFFRDYHPETDRKLASTLTKIYVDQVLPEYHPGFVKNIQGKFRGDYEKWSHHLMKNSIFMNREKLFRFLDHPKQTTLYFDPVFQCSRQIYNAMNTINSKRVMDDEKLDRGNRLFIQGLMEMFPERQYYPDANSTLRLTYGRIGGYYPSDAVYYTYFTTHQGYLEKAIPGDREFDVWPEMKALLLEKDFGDYADKDGTLHTCFISNNDITGGNSGSPVLNKRGELIGIAFDGNWEAMSGDISFEPELQKCINVDIRFVLWVVDKFAGATHLIDEMTILN